MLRKFTESSATIVASLIGGVFALTAALLPNWFGSKNDPAAPPVAAVAPVASVPTSPLPVTPTAACPNFLYGTWTLHAATDDEGTVWDNSTLKFTKQQPTSDGLELAGYFEWRTNYELQGREEFTGNYVAASRQLFIEGERVVNASGRLGVGSFSAKLDEDDRRLIDGRWGSAAGNLANVPGSWQARR